MNELKRNITHYLEHWRNSSNRKALLLRGARQVGKTHSVRKLGENFKHFLEINFEDHKGIHRLFEADMEVKKIIQILAVQFEVPVIPQKTLVFFDEIQACPNAIRSLRYFYEKIPDLHVVAAGSLLEFALEEIPSFGVGRIQSLFMYPLTFQEFLEAIHPALPPIIEKSNSITPLPANLHTMAVDYFKVYQVIGGMPDVVAEYINSGDYMKCNQLLDNLIQSFQTDFAKYRKHVPTGTLQNIFHSIALQAGGKFIYQRAAPELDIKTIKPALELILRAGLAYKVPHTSASGLPLGGQINPRKFKILPLDSGIYQRLLGLPLGEYLLLNHIQLINKGHLAEITAGIQLMHHQLPTSQAQLYYWHRESKSSNAEIDYVIQQKGSIVPVEVKAGTKGQMQSMFLFLKEKRLSRGIRLSLENFGQYDSIYTVPLYAIKSIVE
ncbi:MAG: ATP-binding protein [Candidatus Marinimicrobia bacterium]|nr:ATP-binding protein [Candidatus Neomarinimicrobiota bacterium]